MIWLAYHVPGWKGSQLALEARRCVVDERSSDQEIWRAMMLRWGGDAGQ